ncbi:MAG: hypothetical protein QS721_10170 [Candidatus Endonucleobacter sp. (ex Gigantidas childressi)]|nr:hypothetical protein [Candidatus Endonucleobacter sp. (ex Gigantidas childressi)]
MKYFYTKHHLKLLSVAVVVFSLFSVVSSAPAFSSKDCMSKSVCVPADCMRVMDILRIVNTPIMLSKGLVILEKSITKKDSCEEFDAVILNVDLDTTARILMGYLDEIQRMEPLDCIPIVKVNGALELLYDFLFTIKDMIYISAPEGCWQPESIEIYSLLDCIVRHSFFKEGNQKSILPMLSLQGKGEEEEGGVGSTQEEVIDHEQEEYSLRDKRAVSSRKRARSNVIDHDELKEKKANMEDLQYGVRGAVGAVALCVKRKREREFMGNDINSLEGIVKKIKIGD